MTPTAHPISVALVTRDRPDSLARCLASWRAQLTPPLEIVLSDKAGGIAGTLRSEKGEPLGGVTVTAWPKNFGPGSPLSSVKSRSSGTDGKFSIPSLAPGDYYVAAWEGEGWLSDIITIPDFLSSFTGDAEKVTLDEGAKPQAQVKLISKEKIAAAVAKLP